MNLLGGIILISVVALSIPVLMPLLTREAVFRADEPGPQVVEAPVAFAVVGDSLTEADSPDINAGAATGGSWTYYASGDNTADFVGG